MNLASSLVAFTYFQLLDVMTTLIALKAGGKEASPFVRYVMRAGDLEGLLIAKGIGVLLAGICIWSGRKRVITWINYFFAGVVAWNIAALLAAIR